MKMNITNYQLSFSKDRSLKIRKDEFIVINGILIIFHYSQSNFLLNNLII